MPPFNYTYIYVELSGRSSGSSSSYIHNVNPLNSPLNWTLKRTFDIIISVILLLFLIPLIIPLIYLIHKFQSPGPLFYIQKRSGLLNKKFKIVKFRTMHLNNYDETNQPVENDVRLFPLGNFLRRTGIDEVPQLWNVLKGEMSIIGPRPHLIRHNAMFEQFHPNYNMRTMVLPGITGLAQVRGFRGKINSSNDIVYRINADIHYIENWSLFLDLTILIRTVGVVFGIKKL
jgi:putative colanic acid biosynthesis UDP-glucose lipid carrier transferase